MFVFDFAIFLKYFIGLFTDYICTIYIFARLLNYKFTKNKMIYLVISVLLIPTFSTLLRIWDNPFYGIVFFILVIMSMVILNLKEYKQTISTTSISLGIQYFAEIISIIVLVTVFFLLNYLETNILTELCTSVLQLLIVFLLMKIKRLKNGLRFLNDKKNFGLSLVITGPILILTNLQKEHLIYVQVIILFFGILVSSSGVIIWLRSAITRHYRKRLKLRAEEYSKLELAEQEKEIEKLSDENTSLSSIIHLDNHIMQSIESELKALDNTNLTEKLLTSINQRNEYVNDLLIKSKNLASTGNADIDVVLLDLYIKSASRGIDYNLNTDCDINYLLNNIIPISDFEALLRDLITNSIVDIENNPNTNGKILITISKPNDIYELTIMDNGISNDENIKSISEIIEKSKASIKTNEFDNNDSFTKSLTIRFDGLKNNTELS